MELSLQAFDEDSKQRESLFDGNREKKFRVLPYLSVAARNLRFYALELAACVVSRSGFIGSIKKRRIE